MSQPIQPQQPQQGPPLQPESPFPPVGKKRKRFGWVAMIVTALVSLGIGGAVGGSGDGATTAAPAPTTTVTKTEPAAVEGGGAPTEEPSVEPEPEPTTEAAPAKWDPKPKDFKVSVKVTDKQCFGSAGCSITYKTTLDYLGTQKFPSEGTTAITYEVSGSTDTIIGTIEIDSEGKFEVSEELADTSSSSKKLVAKVTEVDYNEFG